MLFRIKMREDKWFVYEIEANDEPAARRFVEERTDEDLRLMKINEGCNFCGIEEVENLDE